MMQKIEINALETTRTSDPIKNNSVEDSPLLIGLQYTVAVNSN